MYTSSHVIFLVISASFCSCAQACSSPNCTMAKSTLITKAVFFTSSLTAVELATRSSSLKPRESLVTANESIRSIRPTTSITPRKTSSMDKEGRSFFDISLNRYLVYGGAGGLGLVMLLILVASLVCAIVRTRRRRRVHLHKGGCGNKHQRRKNSDRSSLALIAVEPEPELDLNEMMKGKVVLIDEFTDYVNGKRVNANSGFEDDFDDIARITRKKPPYIISKRDENELKNRFDNIYPYDASRVVLTMLDDVQGSDYINASYIDGYDRLNAYIATQGPLPTTVSDFWRMIWEFKLTTVIMLTEVVEAGKEKCEQYWPIAANEPRDVGCSLTVTLTEQIPLAEYQVKILKVENKMDPESCVPLIITHYHFSSWPDHGVPADKTSLIHFIQRVRRHHPYFNSSPLLVHCSAGVGRTGTFITLDSMIQRMKSEDTLDIFEFIRQMRSRRPLMVQTEEQYVFIHEALEEFITCGDTSIGVANLRIALTKLSKPRDELSCQTQFEVQFALLSQVSCKPTSINCTEGKKPYNAKKNRYQRRVPYNISRVYLKQSGVKGSDYVNASYIDGYKQQKAFIATQTPLKSTVNEFWRMVWECQSRALVMLTNNEEEEEDELYTFWPKEENSVVVYGKLKLKLLSEECLGDLMVRRIDLREDTPYHIPGVIDYLVVTQIHHTKWLQTQVPSPETVLNTIDMMLKVQRSTGNHAITVMCNDGMGRTGTFICIFSQLERMKTESICDVFQFVKAMRLQRPWMVLNVEQLSFCYRVLAEFLDTFEHYANFK